MCHQSWKAIAVSMVIILGDSFLLMSRVGARASRNRAEHTSPCGNREEYEILKKETTWTKGSEKKHRCSKIYKVWLCPQRSPQKLKMRDGIEKLLVVAAGAEYLP